MPVVFRDLAARSAEGAGFRVLEPDIRLLNEYAPGARLSLRQDKNERDAAHPNPAATPCGFKKRAGSGRFSAPIPIARHRLFAVLSARRWLPFSTGDCRL